MSERTTPPPTEPSADLERQRALRRRQEMGIVRPDGHAQVQWGLALSGGGIRSATFCLGVLQALAKRSSPGAPPEQSLLSQFDYVSTVSGGGYIGSFFTSLFVNGRVSGNDGRAHPPGQGPSETDLEAARRAYLVMQEDPPARIRGDSHYEPDRPGRTALAWLRDNGRYMAPTGPGDWMYDIAITLRNWMATQYVMGTVIALLLAAVLLLRVLLSLYCPAWADWEHAARVAACNDCARPSVLWWSPTWMFSLVVLALGVVPLGMAYWFSHPPKGATLSSPPTLFSMASVLGAVASAVLLGAAVLVGLHPDPDTGAIAALPMGLAACGALVGLSIAAFMFSALRARHQSISKQRVLLTRWLAMGLSVLIGTAALSTVETLAQTGLLWLSWNSGALLSGALGGLVWLLRIGAPKLGDKSTGSLLSKIPTDLLSVIIGIVLWVAVAACWDALLIRSVWPELTLSETVFLNPDALREMACTALGALAVALILSLIVGRFPGFLNLSTLQSLYSARLTRAYLGASNHRRFAPGAGPQARDVAEPIDGDSLSVADIYRNPLAPTHFVNVCVNQTVSPGEQLVQHDRKGKPLVLAPGGYYFDRQAHAYSASQASNELSYPMLYGEWVGVSGAAFSTGLGRGTSMGMSMSLGFANVRLGRWWPGIPAQTPGAPQAAATQRPHRDGLLRRVFTPQAYLLDELRGRFYAHHRRYQYLSDGGHFENTAVYELINPLRDRAVRLIVMCDCGCDPDYEFDDLANLTRLARIDHGLEIRVNDDVFKHAALTDRFGRPEDFLRRPDGSLPTQGQRCAILLDVVTTPSTPGQAHTPGTVVARILLVKPTLLSPITPDIGHYHCNHPRFPQEPTSDQFFDEAQWESYRQLGLRIGEQLFPADPQSTDGQLFWQVCLQGLPTT
ncbi:MAG TPA: hypothetical protein VFW84_09825 [Aquabacterium sp.]|uniref:hypothetical protein n=1 Tax=Aquabacterium sp. TaxID=1872578 RepID=UPI002E37859A|nr:hypothetical protein [Aquabacterium sp.]HEX5373019.1 hypothetical protein [Aquabacterium sp.]